MQFGFARRLFHKVFNRTVENFHSTFAFRIEHDEEMADKLPSHMTAH
jgi:hypothetical protein